VSLETQEQLLEQVRAGRLDARRLLVKPEAESGAAELAIDALLAAEPTIGELGDGARALLEPECNVRVGELEADRRFWIADLISFWRTAPGDVSRVTSPGDGMFAKTPDLYFPTGAAALRCVRLAMLLARKERCESILDFACGYGRVLRFLRASFPQARLTACDTTREAVDFCAQEFDAIPVYSQEDFATIELPGPFDVIWVGSLFTHVSEPRWLGLLDLLESVLADGGVLVFTTQGRRVREQLVTGKPAWNPLDADAKGEIVRGFDERGFGYADWIGATDYGTTLNSPSWVCAQIERRPGLRLLGMREEGWGRQDVVSCRATRG
jgi:SAM-dependent methyltransferase